MTCGDYDDNGKVGLEGQRVNENDKQSAQYQCARERNIDIGVSFIQHRPLVCVLH